MRFAVLGGCTVEFPARPDASTGTGSDALGSDARAPIDAMPGTPDTSGHRDATGDATSPDAQLFDASRADARTPPDDRDPLDVGDPPNPEDAALRLDSGEPQADDGVPPDGRDPDARLHPDADPPADAAPPPDAQIDPPVPCSPADCRPAESDMDIERLDCAPTANATCGEERYPICDCQPRRPYAVIVERSPSPQARPTRLVVRDANHAVNSVRVDGVCLRTQPAALECSTVEGCAGRLRIFAWTWPEAANGTPAGGNRHRISLFSHPMCMLAQVEAPLLTVEVPR